MHGLHQRRLQEGGAQSLILDSGCHRLDGGFGDE
jgi:hypothetical protein